MAKVIDDNTQGANGVEDPVLPVIPGESNRDVVDSLPLNGGVSDEIRGVIEGIPEFTTEPDDGAVQTVDLSLQPPTDSSVFREKSINRPSVYFPGIREVLVEGDTSRIEFDILPSRLMKICDALLSKESQFPTDVKAQLGELRDLLNKISKKEEGQSNQSYGDLLKKILDGIRKHEVHNQKKGSNTYKDLSSVYAIGEMVGDYLILQLAQAGMHDPAKIEELILSKESETLMAFLHFKAPSVPVVIGGTLVQGIRIYIDNFKKFFKGFPKPIGILGQWAKSNRFKNLKEAIQELCFRYRLAKIASERLNNKNRYIDVGVSAALVPIMLAIDLLIEVIKIGRYSVQVVLHLLLAGLGAGALLVMTVCGIVKNISWLNKTRNYADIGNEAICLLKDAYAQSLSEHPKSGEGDLMGVFDDGETMRLGVMARRYKFPVPHIKTPSEGLIDLERPVVFIIGVGDDSLALAREIDRQGQVNVVIFDADKNNFSVKGGGKKMFAEKGLVYKNGQIYSTEFKKPVEADYVFAEAWGTGNGSMAKAGRVPLAGMPFIGEYTENKEVTKALLESNRVATAPSICFRRSKDQSPVLNKMVGNGILKYESAQILYDMERSLENFCKMGIDEIVVKPTDGECGNGVGFFDKSNLRKAAEAILKLQQDGHNVIVEKRINALPVSIDGVEKDWNLRVFVSRNQANELSVSDMEVRVDNKGGPINISISAAVETFDKICERLGLTPEQASALRGQIEKTALSACKSVEDGVRKNEKIPDGAQQDWFGVDIIVQKDGENFNPHIIEINDHHSGGIWDLDNILPQEEYGRACRELAQVMARRAKAHKSAR